MDLLPIKERIKRECPGLSEYKIDKIVENSYKEYLKEKGESDID